MSQILNCGLDQRQLSILASLIENGVNPEALAAVVKELKRETEALKVRTADANADRQQRVACDT
jgi:mitotic-spindle organizing protein 1